MEEVGQMPHGPILSALRSPVQMLPLMVAAHQTFHDQRLRPLFIWVLLGTPDYPCLVLPPPPPPWHNHQGTMEFPGTLQLVEM